MYRLINAVWIICSLFISMNTHAQNTTTLNQLDEEINALVKQHNVASVSYAIIKNGQPTHINTLGFANLETHSAVSDTTSYRIASISKMIVGIAVMQLVESKQLQLSDNIKTLLPDLEFENSWSSSHPLKLVHLVENTTGWDDISLREFAYDNSAQLPLIEVLAINPASRTSRWPPGTRHAYTNSTAAVAALIVERVTGMTFERYAQQYIFAPLNITNASYEIAPPLLATGYTQQLTPQPYKPVLMSHAGSLIMNISDMAKLLGALVSRDPLLLSKPSYKRMEHSTSTNVGNFNAGYGIFNHARFYDGWRFRGHDGAMRGWRSELSYSPNNNTGFVVLQNTENNAAFRAVVDKIRTFATSHFSTDTDEQSFQAPPKSLQGYYRYQNPRNQMRWFLERLVSPYQLTIHDDSAAFSSVLPIGWNRTLYYQEDDTWYNDKGEPVAMHTVDPLLGEVLHYGDRVLVKTTMFAAWIDKVVLVLWLLMLVAMIPISLFWLVKLVTKKYSSSIQKNARLVTMCVALSGWLLLIFLFIGMQAPIPRLGTMNVISVGLMLATILMALCTAAAIYFYIKHLGNQTSRIATVTSGVLVLCQSAVVCYLAWFGVIGIQTWV